MASKPEIVPSTPTDRVEALPAVEIDETTPEQVEDPSDWDNDPPAPPVETPPADAPPSDPEAPQIPTDTVDYKALVETMDREIAANPVNLLTNLAKTANMSETQVLELVRSLAPQPQESYLPADYEPEGKLEPELVKQGRMDWLFGGEKIVDEKVSKAKAEIAPYIDNANQEVALLRAEIEALKEVSGFKLTVDRKAIQAEVAKGTPFSEAVEKVMGKQIKSEVEKAKQASTPRPDWTPGSGGNDLMERKPGLPMSAYLAAIKNGAKV